MRAGLIDEFLDGVTTRIGDWFSWIPEWWFLGKWWALGFIILAVALVISSFFGALPVIGGWIRGISGFIVLLFAAFLVGLTVAARHYQQERKGGNPPTRPIPPAPPSTAKPDTSSGFDWFRKG